MSEQIHNSGDTDNSPEHQFYLQRKAEIQAEMQQAMHDTLIELGGHEAISFLESMHFDLRIEDGRMPSAESLTEIERLYYPGFWPAVRIAWQPLLDEARLITAVDTGRSRAQKDKEILTAYEFDIDLDLDN